jgi:Protein of unknown function (DUF2911)
LVHEGFVYQGFSNGNPAPWRAGSNENTVIEFDNDVTIEYGQIRLLYRLRPRGKHDHFL